MKVEGICSAFSLSANLRECFDKLSTSFR